jgi:hypothetical protein
VFVVSQCECFMSWGTWMSYPQHKFIKGCFLSVLCTGNAFMLLNGTWRQHKTLTSNTAHTGNSRALDTERDSQITHGDLDHGVPVHILSKIQKLLPPYQNVSFISIEQKLDHNTWYQLNCEIYCEIFYNYNNILFLLMPIGNKNVYNLRAICQNMGRPRNSLQLNK